MLELLCELLSFDPLATSNPNAQQSHYAVKTKPHTYLQEGHPVTRFACEHHMNSSACAALRHPDALRGHWRAASYNPRDAQLRRYVNRSALRSWVATCDDKRPLNRTSWVWKGTPAVPRLNESTLCEALSFLGARKVGTSTGVLIVGDSLAGQLHGTLLGLFKGPHLCGGIMRVDFRRNDFLTIGTERQAAQPVASKPAQALAVAHGRCMCQDRG